MRTVLFILLLSLTASLCAQDRLFFVNGSIIKGSIVSIAPEQVFFRLNDSSQVQQHKKKDLIMAEYTTGERYIFTQNNYTIKELQEVKTTSVSVRNYLGMQPFAFFMGRLTFVYERLSKNGKVGFAFPCSLTFNVFNTIYPSSGDSADATLQEVTGLSYILGTDINFYLGEESADQFFIGPRFRYGTDQTFYGTEGYSLQTQFGWRFNSIRRFTQHISFGFGFIRVLDVSPNSGFSEKQSYGWYSINYRLGIRW